MINKNDTIILFDLDGTIIDSTDAILASFHVAFKEQNFDFQGTDEDIKDEIGYPLDVMFQALGVPKERAWDFVDSYKNYYRTISEEQTYLLPQGKEAVIEASKIARLGVVTTKTTQYSIPILKTLGIFEYFETIIGRQEVQNPKPHPEPVLNALKNMDVQNHPNCYMVGDTKLDLIAAKEAGVKSVGVLCGYGKEDDLKQYTPYVVKDALEAVETIKKNL